jgi:orotate phosphoribosyltransferase
MKLSQVPLRDLELNANVVQAVVPIVLEASEVRDLSADIAAVYRTHVNPAAGAPGRPQREANADTFPIALNRPPSARLHFIYDSEETRLALECQSIEEAGKVFRLWREQRIVSVDLDYIRSRVRGSLSEIVAAVLWQLGAIKVSLGDLRPLFTVDAGRNRSPIYVDVRSLPNYPIASDFMVSQAALLLRPVAFDALCGIEAGSIAFAAELAQKLAKPMFFARRVRKFPEAPLLEGIKPHELFRKRVVLVDDTLVKGWTKERVVTEIRDQGGIIDTCFVIFDRQQDGRVSLERLGVNLLALTDRKAALSPAIPREITFLTDQEYREAEDYFQDPAAWHRRKGLDYHELTDTGRAD